MTNLPIVTDFTDANRTNAQMKITFTDLHDYLVGLLGTDGLSATALAALGSLAGRYVAKTAAYTVTTADRGMVINCTGTFTLSLPPSATAGAGFSFLVFVDLGVVTLAPAGIELIQSVNTFPVSVGQACLLVCTGTGWAGLLINAADGSPIFTQPVVLQALSTPPSPPASGNTLLFARNRAGKQWLDIMPSIGRGAPMQSHLGYNQAIIWIPKFSTAIDSYGMSPATIGTISHPAINANSLVESIRRWRVATAATVNTTADQRSAYAIFLRGNTAGVGGFTIVDRIALSALQATGMGYFGVHSQLTALSSTLVLDDIINGVGIGFQSGVHTNWQLVYNDALGAPTLVDLGANFPVNSYTNIITLYIFAAPNSATIGVRVVEEVSGASAEFTLTTDIPDASQVLTIHNYMNNGATAASVSYDCFGVYIETDF